MPGYGIRSSDRCGDVGGAREAVGGASVVRSVTLSPAQARRVALAAQGFGRPPRRPVATRALNAAFDRLGLLQIDSVNVFERSHYLPLFARLGAYDRSTLDRLTFGRSGPYTEYWAHEAAFIPRDDLAAVPVADGRPRERDAGPTRVDGVTGPLPSGATARHAPRRGAAAGERDRARVERPARPLVGVERREARARAAVPLGRRR